MVAENKYVKAMNKLGDWYKLGIFLGRNIDLAIKWYEKSAKEDDVEAIEKLIEIYEKGFDACANKLAKQLGQYEGKK